MGGDLSGPDARYRPLIRKPYKQRWRNTKTSLTLHMAVCKLLCERGGGNGDKSAD